MSKAFILWQCYLRRVFKIFSPMKATTICKCFASLLCQQFWARRTQHHVVYLVPLALLRWFWLLSYGAALNYLWNYQGRRKGESCFRLQCARALTSGVFAAGKHARALTSRVLVTVVAQSYLLLFPQSKIVSSEVWKLVWRKPFYHNSHRSKANSQWCETSSTLHWPTSSKFPLSICMLTLFVNFLPIGFFFRLIDWFVARKISEILK